MAEGIDLPSVARGTLLHEEVRLARLAAAVPQILAVVAGETDPVAVQATLARLLWDAFPQASWCGFYRRVGPTTLAVGPYQGPMGCLRIEFSRGVCGACARTGEVQVVEDVDAFPGHIACDAGARSELVVPVVAKGELRAVLDLDSYSVGAFSRREGDALVGLLREAFDSGAVAW